MDPIAIVISTDASGAVTGIKQATDELGNLNQAAGQASSGGLAGFNASVGTMLTGLGEAAGGAAGVGALIAKFVQLGESVQLTTQGLNAMSGGQADQYTNQMRNSTHGLIDDMTLAKDATLALSTGVVTTSAGMANLAADGATLGRVFQGDASTGIQSLIRDIEMVGSTRGLKQLGLDAVEVKARFEELKSQGVPDAQAWAQAVMEAADALTTKLGPSLDTAGSSIDKFSAQAKNALDDFGSIAAGTFEAALVGANKLIDGIHGVVDAFATGRAQVALGLAMPGSEYGITQFGSSLGEDAIRQQGQSKMANWNMGAEQNQTFSVLGGGGPADPAVQAAINAAVTAAIAAEGSGASMATSNPLASRMQAGAMRENAEMTSGSVYNMSQDQLAQQSLSQQRHDQLSGTEAFIGSDQITKNLDAQLGKLHDIKDAEADAAQTANARAEAEDKIKASLQAQTAAQILGAKSNTLASDIASGADTSVSAQHAALQAELDKKVGHYDPNGSGVAGGGAAVDALNPKLAKAKAHYDDLAYAIAHTKHETETQALAFSDAAAALTKLTDAQSHAKSGGSTGPYKVFTKADEAAALAASDREAKNAKDQYMIATGQATAASIKEADVQADLNAKMASGAISATDYYAALTKMYQAAQAGTLSLQSLTRAQQAQDLAAAPAKQKLSLVHSQRADQADAATDESAAGSVQSAPGKYQAMANAATAASGQMDRQDFGATALQGALSLVQQHKAILDHINGKTYTNKVITTYVSQGTPPPNVNSAGDRQ